MDIDFSFAMKATARLLPLTTRRGTLFLKKNYITDPPLSFPPVYQI